MDSTSLNILKKWGEHGIDIGYIEAHLNYAKNQDIFNKRTNIMEDQVRYTLKDIKKDLKSYKNSNEIIDYLTLNEEHKTATKKAISDKTKELNHWEKHFKKFIRDFKNKYHFPNPNLYISLTSIYNHLKDRVGISAYGKDKAVPLRYQEEMLTLFNKISPEDFPLHLNPDTLRQRISYINKKYRDFLYWYERIIILVRKVKSEN